MTEVLGIASGIAGLLSLTIEVFGISYKYINGVRDASSSARRFLNELEALQKVLYGVEQSAKQRRQVEVFDDAHSCFLSIEKSDEYMDLLEKVRDKLQQRQTPSSFRNNTKALTWPFSEKETLALIESLHRHLEIYSTALAVDNRTIGELTLNEVKKINVSQDETQIEAALDWLSPLNMYQKQQDTLSRRHGLTGSWLLNDPVFKSWLDSECPQATMWCPGDPGTGKTIITSVVIDYLINNYKSKHTKVAYIYCDYKDQDAQTASNLVACLARQIIGRPRELPRQLAQLHTELKQQNRRPSFDELKGLLVAFCNQYKRTYIVVDALDECEEHERRRLLPVLKSLEGATTKLFVTSRPKHEDIVSTFRGAPKISIVTPESDLCQYVKEKIEEREDFANRLTLSLELKNEITSTIPARACGMFLLAALQIDRIFATRTIKGVKSALASLPGGLDELYRQTLERIQKQAGDDGKLGMRILSWITHARRPLSVDELRHGLAVEYSDDGEGLQLFDGDNLLSPGSLVDVCAGLVIIDSNSQKVRLVHYTTQEYLNKARLHLFNCAEVDISRVCLTYLSYMTDRELRKSFVRRAYLNGDMWYEELWPTPFLDYAYHYWFSHVKRGLLAKTRDPVFLKVVARFKSSDSMLISTDLLHGRCSWHDYLGRRKDVRNQKVSPVEIASELGLEELLTVLLDPSTITCPISDESLSLASSAGNLDVVKLLLRYGARVNSTVENENGETMTALGIACKYGYLSIAEFLIDSGADIYGTHAVDSPALHDAVMYDFIDIIDLLLKKGVNVNARDPIRRTACHLAASYGNVNSARRLIDAGCDLELTDGFGETALHYAARSGYYDTIRLFLDRGADASAKDWEGKTARKILLQFLKDSTNHNPENREILGRLVEELRQLEQKTSTPTTNDPEESEANPSKE